MNNKKTYYFSCHADYFRRFGSQAERPDEQGRTYEWCSKHNTYHREDLFDEDCQ